MRDALSILDQAIASCGDRLTEESVRQLVGAAPSGILEEVMGAVARSSSEEVLWLIDKLMSEGHNATHFARQMVQFLRNAVVARVAGTDSSLLQISKDERERVGRVAELFSEEDLARYLQIMLRTHGELGYKQEQRFHLELGLLKMAHAQRLLPIEQLLSAAESAPSAAQPPRATSRPAVVGGSGESRRPADTTARGGLVSPFAADSARKAGGKPELSAGTSSESGARVVAALSSPARVVMGSAAPAAVEVQAAEEDPETPETGEIQVPSQVDVRSVVLRALDDSGQRMLISMLETGEWKLEGNEIVVKVAVSQTVIDMSLGAEAKRVAIASASGALGRQVKLKVIPGGAAQAPPPTKANTPNGGGRNRAEQDPIVRRMREKFGAEIRTIIDHREKR